MKILLSIAAFVLASTGAALADAVDDMLDTDRAFAAKSEKDGAPAAFAAFAAEDVRMFPGGREPRDGRDAMIAQYTDWPEGDTLTWTPVAGVAGAAGDFGYTWGRSIYSFVNDEGETINKHGKYISIWRKSADGSWKFVADMGNGNPAPEERE